MALPRGIPKVEEKGSSAKSTELEKQLKHLWITFREEDTLRHLPVSCGKAFDEILGETGATGPARANSHVALRFNGNLGAILG